MFRTIGNKLKGRTKTVDKTLIDKELVDLLEMYAIIDGGRDIQRASVKYVDDANKLDCPVDGLGNVPLFDVKELFIQKLSTPASALDLEYTDINYQSYTGKDSEKHYITIVHGNIKLACGTTRLKRFPDRTASIEFEVKKGYVHPHSAPPA